MVGKNKREKTDYPGIFARQAKRLGGPGLEKVFYAVYKKNGKVYEEKCGRQYKDGMSAAKAARIRADLIEGRRQTRAEVKAAEARAWIIDKLWDEYQKRNPHLKSLGPDRNRYDKHLKLMFGSKQPHEITQFDVDKLRLKMLKTLSPQHTKLTLALLRRIVRFGVNKNLCSPLGFMIQMPKVDNIVTEDLTAEQLSNLLEAIDNDYHPHAGRMMKLALFTGMRRGEMFNLKWTDIDFERGFIHIRDPKGGRGQTIPLNDAARELLENHRRISDWVFPGRDGNKRTEIKNQVNRIKRAAGLPKEFRPLHGLRHVYASMLASSGEVDLYQLQRLLTHKDPSMTLRYAHLRDEALKKAASVAGNIINEVAIQKNHTESKKGG